MYTLSHTFHLYLVIKRWNRTEQGLYSILVYDKHANVIFQLYKMQPTTDKVAIDNR